MPAHFDKYISKHPADKLYEIVKDVEKYPEFLPWIAASRILERNNEYFVAELLVKFKNFSHSYSSKIICKTPNSEQNCYSVDTKLVKGPFKFLTNKWHFVPLENGGTEIIFELDFKFNSIILEKLIGMMFESTVKKMTTSFESRANQLIL